MSKLSKTNALEFFTYSKNIPSNFYDEEIFNAYIEQYIKNDKLYESNIESMINHINKYSFSNAQLSKLHRRIINYNSFNSNNDNIISQLIDTLFSRLDTSNIDEILTSIAENANSEEYNIKGYSDQELKFLKKCKLSKEFFMKYGIYELYDHPSITTDIIADVFIKGNKFAYDLALTKLSKNDLYSVFDKIFLTNDIEIIRKLTELCNIDLLVDFITTSTHDYRIKCDLHALIPAGRKIELNETQADALLNATINKDICKALLICSKYCIEVTKDLDLDILNVRDAYYLINSKYCTVELLRKFSKDKYENNHNGINGIEYEIVKSPMCPSDILVYWAIPDRHSFSLYKYILNNPNYDQNVNDVIVNTLTSTKITSYMCSGWTDYTTIKYLDKSPYLTREQRLSLCCTPSDHDIFYILPNNLTESEITALFNCWEKSEFELQLLEKLITQPKCSTKILLKAIKLGIKGAINHSKITSDLLEQLVDVCDPKFYDSILCSKCNYNTIIKIVKNGYDNIDKLKDIIELKIASSTEDYEKFTNAHLAIIDKILEQIK